MMLKARIDGYLKIKNWNFPMHRLHPLVEFSGGTRNEFFLRCESRRP